MDRTERIGLGFAIAGHVVLFGLLSVGFLATPNPELLESTPIEVSLVDEVGLFATAPQSVTPPAEALAPDLGPMEDAPPPAEALAEANPTPPAPQPEPAPAPKAAERAPAPEKKAAPEKRERSESPPKREAAPEEKARPERARSTGSDRSSTRERPRGKRLGEDFLEGITDSPSESKSTTPRAARIDARTLAGIQEAIRRQIQPCADRQVNPGPGANEISVELNLRLNRNGTLAATPKLVGRPKGVTSENARYVQRVVDLGIAAFKGCAPLRLPQEYYMTANGGWANINYTWQLR